MSVEQGSSKVLTLTNSDRRRRRRGSLRACPPDSEAIDTRTLSRSLFLRLAALDEGQPGAHLRTRHPHRAQPPARALRGGALPQPQRADGGHRPGRHDRPDQGDRPLRLRTGRGVPDVRDADRRRRDQALLPRHVVVGAGAAPPPGAAARADQGQRRALPEAGPLPDRARTRRGARGVRGGRGRRPRRRQRVHRLLAGLPVPRGRRRRGLPRGPPRLRGHARWRASSTASPSSRCWPNSRPASGRSSCCASSPT